MRRGTKGTRHGNRIYFDDVRFLLYNCKVGRDPDQVANFVERLMNHRHLKVALLEEATQYHRALDAIKGFTLYQFRHAPDSANVAILVRDDGVSKFLWLVTMKRRWWGAKNHRWRDPRSILAVRAFKIRWVALHRVAYQAARRGWNLKSNVEIDRWLTGRFGNSLRRIVIGGDINDTANSPEVKKLTREAGFEVASIGGIDFSMFKGDVEVEILERLEDTGGSDHHPKIGVARPYRQVKRAA